MPKQLLIATTNPAKFADYKNLLKDYNLELVNLDKFKISPPEETGKTFEDNAINKARYYFQQSKIPTLVDDGGFEIEGLNNEPGVKSHRWLGREMSDEEMVEEVMKRTKDLPEEKKRCHMRMVVAVATSFGIVTSEGSIAGVVASTPSEKRIKGYPYRSVMYLPNYGKYFCEIDDAEHEILNHRKHALEKISDILLELSK